MSTATFAEALMSEPDTRPTSELSLEEQEMLAAAGRENVDSPQFEFATSAHFKAIDHVRRNQDKLPAPLQKDFGWYVANTFTRTYGSALVESGCIRMA